MAESGIVRQPRAWLMAGGSTINIMGFEARLVRGDGESSSAEVTMALDDPTNPGPMFWSTGGLIPASIVATNGDSNNVEANIFIGYVEMADVDFDTRTVTAHMVDGSRFFIDNRSDASWNNQTTDQIVQQLAAKHGIPVQADPGSMAGTTYDGQNYTFLSDLQSDWDVIHELAKQDGYIYYFADGTLYYVDPGNVSGASFAINYTPPASGEYETANAVKLRCTHNFALGQGVQATVMSWHQELNQALIGQSGSGSWQAARRIPGLVSPQVQNLAARLARDASMHEYGIEIEAPGDVIVQPTMMLPLSGTQSAFDMTYYMYEVVHRMNDDDGYTMEIVGYNSAPSEAGSVPSDTDTESPAQGQQQPGT